MKIIILFPLLLFITVFGMKAQVTHVISVNGFAYSPDSVTVSIGDTVKIQGSDAHPCLEVSEETWLANGIAALSGGFSFPAGSGKVTFGAAGIHYFVCTAHVASDGMKGRIFVVAATAVRNIAGSKMSVYPSPLVGNELTVSFKNPVNKNFEISVYDIAGNLRISTAGSTTDGIYKLDCTKLPKGLFLLRMKAGNETDAARIVRE